MTIIYCNYKGITPKNIFFIAVKQIHGLNE